MKYVFKSILWHGNLRSQRAKSLLSHQKWIIKAPVGIIVSSNKNPTGNISGKKNSQYVRFYHGGRTYWPWMWTENNLKDWCLCNNHSLEKPPGEAGTFSTEYKHTWQRCSPVSRVNYYKFIFETWKPFGPNSTKGLFLGSYKWKAVASRRKDEYQVNTCFLCIST